MGKYRHFYTDLNIVHIIELRLYFPDDSELSFGIQSLLANSANREEMPNHAAFNLGLHYLKNTRIRNSSMKSV